MTAPGTVRLACLVLLLLFAFAPVAGAQPSLTEEEVLRLGEAMYVKGILPSGQVMKGIVQGDMELTGKMSTCANCHRISGLGSLEGGVLTPPTNGAKLYVPLKGQADIPGSVMKRSAFKKPRPAYTDETLANAILYGTDPTGKPMSETMPRYDLDEKSMKIMISYLKNLSSTLSPGVTDTEIKFATIVTDDVSPGDREAMLLPLQAYLRDEWNARLSVIGSQWNIRWYGAAGATGGVTFRKASLDVWELKGPASTWESQLERYSREKPAFAVLGGMTQGEWAPIHRFCEKNALPCLFPITDFPVVSAGDWYTMYFSRGGYQEGEAAAKYLSRMVELPEDRRIVQVYRDTPQGRMISRGFADTWKRLGKAALTDRVLSSPEKTGQDFWKKLSIEQPNSVLLLWLDSADLAGIEALAETGNRPPLLFLSATGIDEKFTSIPDTVRDFALITYPNRLPDEDKYPRSIVTSWLRMKKIQTTNLDISAKMYFLTRLLSTAMLDMGRDLYRDFFLDLLDDSVEQVNSSLSYPILTFGPGQRYASKGCYIVSVTKGDSPRIVRQSDWVIY